MEQKALGGNSVEFFKEKIEGAEETAKTYADGLVGKARVLTTDDYNWNSTTNTATEPYDCVALWLLDDGIYSFTNFPIRFNSVATWTKSGLAIVRKATLQTSPGDGSVLYMPTNENAVLSREITTSGSRPTTSSTTVAPRIINNLTTATVGYALSANQGRVLKDLIDSIAIRGAGAPTTSTVGEVGQLYEDGTNGALYQLKSIDITVTPNTYNWEEVGAGDVKAVYLTPTNVTSTTISVTADKTVAEIKGWADADKEVLFLIKLTQGFGGFAAGVYCFRLAAAHTDLVRAYAVDPTTGGVWTYLQNSNDGYNATVTIKDGAPTVVQTTGTSTTDVMSQNAVTSMVYADPATRYRIAIGSSSSTIGTAGTAIGLNAQVSNGADGGVAIGVHARAGQKGEMNIGVNSSTDAPYYGYNGSQYRLLTGVYDGQSAHDAATYGQVISYSAINGAGAPTTATEGKYVGQLYYDTTNEAMYFLKAIDTTTTPATYTWEALGGGSSVNVVQTTGTSTTDVMSQNAVTSMVFADPSTRQRVQIGASSLAQGESVAIGDMANSSGTYAVTMGYAATTGMTGAIALGANSLANSVGEMNIGSSDTHTGYNSSNYRLLTGLYDPQNAHDAANKGYVDNSITTAISGIVGVEFEVVQTLPATGDAGTIYLVPNQGATPNIYDEYIYVNNAFEKIGTTEIDLSNYVTNTDLQTTLANYTLSSSLSTVATSGDYNDLTNTPSTFTANEWNALWA